jgi:hypothetical protein
VTSKTLQSTAALLLAAALGPSAAVSATELQYREAWGHAVVIPIRVNGQGPFELVLDTGSSHSAVREDFARRLGLVSSAGTTVATIAGISRVGSAHLDHLELGTSGVRDVEVSVAPLPALRDGEGEGIVGLLGQSALRGLDFTLDHRRRRILFEDSRCAGIVRPYEIFDGVPTVLARLDDGADTVRLALDSGIAHLLLFERGELPLEPKGWMHARTNGGDVRLRSGRLDALWIGDSRLEAVDYVLQSDRAGRSIDGLLPTRLFERVRFEPSRGVVRLVLP